MNECSCYAIEHIELTHFWSKIIQIFPKILEWLQSTLAVESRSVQLKHNMVRWKTTFFEGEKNKRQHVAYFYVLSARTE